MQTFQGTQEKPDATPVHITAFAEGENCQGILRLSVVRYFQSASEVILTCRIA